MSIVCALPMQDRTEEKQKEIDQLTQKKKWYRPDLITSTEFGKKMVEGVSNYIKWYTTDAKYVDLLKDVYDKDKAHKRFADHANTLKNIFAPIKDNPRANELYFELKRLRYVRRELSKREDSDVLKYDGYMEWLKNNKGGDVQQYRDAVERNFFEVRKEAMDYQPLKEVYQRLSSHYNDMIKQIVAIDPNVASKLIGGKNDDPMDMADQIAADFENYKDVKSIKDFYKKVLKTDIEEALNYPEYLDLVTMNMIDMYHKQSMLHKFAMDNNINDKLIDILKGIKIESMTPEKIQALEDNNELKIKFNEAFDIIMDDPNYSKIFDGYHKASGNLFESLYQTLNDIANLKMREGSYFLSSISFRNFIESRKEVYPELYKAANGKKYDEIKAYNELKSFNAENKTSHKFDDSSIHEAEKMFRLKENISNAVKQFNMDRSIGIIDKIKKMHPGYTLVTNNGTAPFGTDMNTLDARANTQILGHLANLSNAELIADDVTQISELINNGDDALIRQINEGKLNLIPQKDAEAIDRVKRTITEKVNNFGLNKINKVFSLTTLFAPWNLPGYMLTTQLPGNIGWTMTADPAAFKRWPTTIKHLKSIIVREYDPKLGKNVTRFDFDKIDDPDMKRIIQLLMTSEGSTILGMTANDLDILDNADFLKDLKEQQEQRGGMRKLVSKWGKRSTLFVSFLETTSRASMAMEVLDKYRKDKVYIPPTANKLRVDYLWGVDDHLAAVRVANDTHIDYANLHPIIRKIGRWAPFFSYMGGSSMLMYRQFVNTYAAVKDAMKSGDWKTANAYLGRGAISVAWRAGVAATIWGSIMVGLGILSKEKRDQMNKQNKSNIFNSLFGKAGLQLDNNFYIPGTGFKPVDQLLRLGKGSQKGDVFADPEAMIPGLDDFWRKDGLKGAVQTAAGKIASRLSPIIKTPIEVAMGGGSITESGYMAPRSGSGFGENLTTKLAGFVGLGTASREIFDEIHGNPSEFRSDGAYAVNEFSSKFYDAKTNGEGYEERKAVNDRMRHMDPDGTIDAIRGYEYALSKAGKTQHEITQSVRNIFNSNSLSNMINKNKDLLKGMSKDELDRLQSAIKAQQDFYNTLGYGRW